jgi:uncharacterized protein YndB with AHSA1/START domain
MQFETTVEIAAPEQAVWAALTDIRRWPEWTEPMRDVRWIDDDGMRVGARARIKQPGTPPLTWTVSEIEAGRAFAWEASSPGVKTVGTHVVRAAGEHGSTLTLGLKQSGALAGLVGALTGARTRTFVQMEADGLKRAAESASAERSAQPASAERSAQPASAERSAQPASAERSAQPASAERAAESASAGRVAQPATAGRTAEAASAGRGADVRPAAG